MIPVHCFHIPLVPQNIAEMNALLAQCTPHDMSPIKNRLGLTEQEAQGTVLPIELFLQAMAYPIQSYRVDPLSKLTLYQHITRLYPMPSLEDPLRKVHEIALQSLQV